MSSILPFSLENQDVGNVYILVQEQKKSQGSWSGTILKTAIGVGLLGAAFYAGRNFEAIESSEVYAAAARLYEEASEHSDEASKTILRKIEDLNVIQLMGTFNTSAKAKIGDFTQSVGDLTHSVLSNFSNQVTGFIHQV